MVLLNLKTCNRDKSPSMFYRCKWWDMLIANAFSCSSKYHLIPRLSGGSLKEWGGRRPKSCFFYPATKWAPFWCGKAPAREVRACKPVECVINLLKHFFFFFFGLTMRNIKDLCLKKKKKKKRNVEKEGSFID